MSAKSARMLSGLLLATLLALAGAIVGVRGASSQPQPRLSSLDVEVWPEYDKPANWTNADPPALVIIRGQLPPSALPAQISLRIPAAAGRPYAVASSASADATLVDREYQTVVEGDSLRITFESPDPIVHVEFYLPLTKEGTQRQLTYVWPGDLGADDVTLRVQVPVGVSDLQTEPDLGPAQPADRGLLYRQADLGALGAGQTLSLHIRYDKQDPRFTVDTLPSPVPAQPAAGGGGGASFTWPVLAAVAAVLAVGIALLVWYRFYQRRPAPVGPAAGRRRAAGYCTRCGQALAADDRFCSRCGAPARKA